MRRVDKIIMLTLCLYMLCVIPVCASNREDEIVFGDNGQYGSVYGEEYTNEAGEVTNWLTIKPGDRGIRIVNDENVDVVVIDKYGGVYIKGQLFINGEEQKKTEIKEEGFSFENGFIYMLAIVSLVISLYSLTKIKEKR